MFKVPTMNKKKKEKDNTKNWKRFSVSLNRFELDDVNDSKIIDKLVLKLLISLISLVVYCRFISWTQQY